MVAFNNVFQYKNNFVTTNYISMNQTLKNLDICLPLFFLSIIQSYFQKNCY